MGSRPRLARERGAAVATASHYALLRRAWLAAVDSLFDDASATKVAEAMAARDPRGALLAIGGMGEQPLGVVTHGERVAFEALALASAAVLVDAQNAAARRAGIKLEYFVPGSGVKKGATRVPIDMDWVRKRAAKQVVEITREQREKIRGVLSRALREDQRPTTIVREIKRVVGLTSREHDAVDRKRSLLESSGVSQKKVEREVDAYAERLRSLRAERIARTEAVAAETQGQQAAWEDAIESGEIEEDSEKEWIASGDACEEICQPMDGERVAIDEQFTLPNGESVDGPGAHPHCLCGMVLRRGRIAA